MRRCFGGFCLTFLKLVAALCGLHVRHMCRYVRVHKSLSASQHPRHALSLTLSENVEIISGESVMQFTRLSTEGTRSLADLAQDSDG